MESVSGLSVIEELKSSGAKGGIASKGRGADRSRILWKNSMEKKEGHYLFMRHLKSVEVE